jgi:hypothetical protein
MRRIDLTVLYIFDGLLRNFQNGVLGSSTVHCWLDPQNTLRPLATTTLDSLRNGDPTEQSMLSTDPQVESGDRRACGVGALFDPAAAARETADVFCAIRHHDARRSAGSRVSMSGPSRFPDKGCFARSAKQSVSSFGSESHVPKAEREFQRGTISISAGLLFGALGVSSPTRKVGRNCSRVGHRK